MVHGFGQFGVYFVVVVLVLFFVCNLEFWSNLFGDMICICLFNGCLIFSNHGDFGKSPYHRYG